MQGTVVREDDKSVALDVAGGKTEQIAKQDISERFTEPAFIEMMQRHIKLLGDEDWDTRETSTRILKRFGYLAEPLIETALNNPDAEVVYRAQGILNEIGLCHHTPSALWTGISREVKSDKPEKWESYFNRATDKLAQGKPGEAEQLLLKSIFLSRKLSSIPAQETANVCFTLGDLYFERENWPAAIECYLEGLARDAWHGEVNYRLGSCYEQTGDTESALARYKLSIKLTPDHNYADQANQKIKALAAQAPPPDGNENIPLKQAKVILLPLNVKTAGPTDKIKKTADTIADNLGITVEVRENRNLLDDSFKTSKDSSQYDATKIQKLMSEIYEKEFAGEAIALIGITFKDITGPQSNFVFTWSGKHAAVFSYGQMHNDLNLENDRDLGKLLRRMSAQLATSVGQTLQTRNCTNAACAMVYVGSLDELDKRSANFCPDCARLFKGYVLAYLKHYDRAEKLVRAYLDKYPLDSSARFELALIYWRIEDWDRAIEAFERVMKIEPDNEGAKDGLTRARQLKAQQK